MQGTASHDPTIDGLAPSVGIDSVSLVFIGPEFVQSAVLREGSSLLVGRTEPAEVVLVDPTVSRQHARFSLEQGVLRVEDAGSHNGLLVNGNRTRSSVVTAADRVRIGSFEVATLTHYREDAQPGRELSSLRLSAMLGEELERARYTRRPVFLCAVRWLADAPSMQQVGRAAQALRSIDRYCMHTPHIALLLLLEYDVAGARSAVEALCAGAGGATVRGLVSAPLQGNNAESLLAAAIDLVQRDASAVEAGGPAKGDLPVPPPQIIVGEKTRHIFELASRTGHADLPVLILGETGVGKEIVARTFHTESRRAGRAFAEINCATLAPTLLESTLFGHEKGAFTGADKRSIGLFEEAHEGTLFLDEVGELSSGAQSALLRALELKRIRRLGGREEFAVDVRIIAATNRNLAELVAKGLFREDLLYRLEALTVRVAPLRERRDEIEPLATLFLANAARRWSAPARELSEQALEVLTTFAWPGNARQLRNAIERAVAVCTSAVIDVEDLPEHLSDGASLSAGLSTGDAAGSLPMALRSFEIAHIRAALLESGGNRSQAARLLGLPRRTLGTKLREYGLE